MDSAIDLEAERIDHHIVVTARYYDQPVGILKLLVIGEKTTPLAATGIFQVAGVRGHYINKIIRPLFPSTDLATVGIKYGRPS